MFYEKCTIFGNIAKNMESMIQKNIPSKFAVSFSVVDVKQM